MRRYDAYETEVDGCLVGGVTESPVGDYVLFAEVCEKVLPVLCDAKRPHYSCDDTWYNCPAFADEDYCTGLGECTCGADEWNVRVDDLIAKLEATDGV